MSPLNALRVLKEEGLIYSVQGRGVFVRQLSPRDQFLKRYNEGLEEMAAQRRADEEAVRLSGKSDDEVAADSPPPRSGSPRPAPSSKPLPPTVTPCAPSWSNASASVATTRLKNRPPASSACTTG